MNRKKGKTKNKEKEHQRQKNYISPEKVQQIIDNSTLF